MRTIFRFLALVMAAMLLLSGTALAELKPAGTLPISDETIHLTIGVPQSAMIEDWETNKQTLLLEHDLNVDLEFIVMSSGDEYSQKLDLMMMSDEKLPDIIMGSFDLSSLIQYAQMGKIIPLTEYFERGDAYFTEQTLKEGGYTLEERLRYVTCTDGEVYGMFGFADTVHNSYSRSFCFVYEPWLEKLGIEKPQTTEEFAEMLRRFKNEDPNGNGEADEIPLMGCSNYLNTNLMRFLMNPFIYTQGNYWRLNEETNQVEFVANMDEWKEGIKWVKSLIDEGLLSPLSITQDQNQLTAIMNPEPEVVGCVARISVTNLGASDIRRSQYVCLDPLEGPNGVRKATREPILPTIRAFITADCENPDAAFRLLDYMNEEMMSVWSRYGEKDVDWKTPDEGSVGAFEPLGYPAQVTVISTWGVLQNTWYAQIGPNVLLAKWGSGQAAANIQYNAAVAIGRSMEKTVEFADPNPLTGFVYTEDEQDVINEFQSTINTYVVNSWSEFVTGVRDIDKEWDAYVGEFAKMGLNEYMAAVQSCYERMYGE